MKAVDWVRNAVLAVLMAEIRELTAPPAANGRKGETPVGPGTAKAPVPEQFAIAAVEVSSAASAVPAKVQPLRRMRDDATKIDVISSPQQKQNREKISTAKI